MDSFKHLLLLSIILGVVGLTTQEEEPTQIVGIMAKSVELPCSLPKDVSNRLEWLDFVYNANRDPKVIYRASDGEISQEHPRREAYKLNNKYTLTISDLHLDDAGIYFCRITNSDGSFTTLHKYKLQVMGMPTCTAEEKYNEGDSAELVCGVQYNGNEIPTIQWSTNGQTQSGDDQTTLEEFRMNLQLSSVTGKNDKQVYTCNVTIGPASGACTVKLNVKYSVRDIEITPKKDSYAVGDSIRCAAKGNPPPTIEWKPEMKGKVGAGWKSFVVPKEWLGKKKTFTCRASNPGKTETNFLSRNISFIATDSDKMPTKPKTETKIVVEKPKPVSSEPETETLAEEPVTSKQDIAEPRPELIKEAPSNGGAGAAAASAGGVPLIGIVIGVVAGLFVLIVLIAVIIVARRKSNRKAKGHKQVPTSDYNEKEDLRNSMEAKGGSPGNRMHKGADRNSNGVVYYNAGPKDNRPSAYITATAEDLDPDTPWRRQNDYV